MSDEGRCHRAIYAWVHGGRAGGQHQPSWRGKLAYRLAHLHSPFLILIRACRGRSAAPGKLIIEPKRANRQHDCRAWAARDPPIWAAAAPREIVAFASTTGR